MQYVKKEGTEGIEQALASGEAGLNGHFAAPLLLRLEAGDPIVILAGEQWLGDRLAVLQRAMAEL